MAANMEIQIIKRETVRPSSPTPDNSRRYELSFLDQLSPTDPIPPLLLFYPGNTRRTSVSETAQLLTKSLSQTLTRFYHFAGRFRDNIAIDCNDGGAEFVATRVSCPLSEILTNPDFARLKEFAPVMKIPKEALFSSPLLHVKANFFECGGLAIGISLSHKVADASTLSTFLNSWADAANSELEPAQLVSSASIFTPLESLVSFPDRYQFPSANEKTKLKRLVFHRKEIEALKSKAGSNSTVQNPTRVDAVSALIWKCVIKASSESVAFRASSVEADKTELQDLVALLRKGLNEVKAIWKDGIPTTAILSPSEEMFDGGIRQLMASSWCKFPLYGVNFGWGKPAWICMPNTIGVKNACVMMDTEGGEGIEVSLVLDEEEMKRFETNTELLAFASLDPAVIF